MRHVLVIEDNHDISELIALHLRDIDCKVTQAADGETGLDLALTGGFDLIVLDLMLPGLGGLEVCRRLRRDAEYTPILMLTAKSSEMDRVTGLELGADDYLTKPFSVHELRARVKAIFRRVDNLSGKVAEAGMIDIGDLSINTKKRTVSLGDQPVGLTAKEFDLLEQFARHPGRVYTRAQLLDLIWGYGHANYEHTVNSHINRLRAKIEADPAQPKYVVTVWGVGYKFNDRLAA